jgi:hypothetical protein
VSGESEPPPTVTVEGHVAQFLIAGPPTPNELFVACGRVGRNQAVELLVALWERELLTREAATANVASVWSDAEFPDSYAAHSIWRELFLLAGYTVDGRSAERPTVTLTLWRGSVSGRRADWSWTDDRSVAETYADGAHYQRPKGTVWRASVEPWRLLAQNTDRQEREYVVDTFGLTITEA